MQLRELMKFSLTHFGLQQNRPNSTMPTEASRGHFSETLTKICLFFLRKRLENQVICQQYHTP